MSMQVLSPLNGLALLLLNHHIYLNLCFPLPSPLIISLLISPCLPPTTLNLGPTNMVMAVEANDFGVLMMIMMI